MYVECTLDKKNVIYNSFLQVKVTRQHNEECKVVLKLMGVPYLDVSEYHQVVWIVHDGK
jgi:hypothetical protein